MVEEFSKYEKARILGARSLQISMDAPLLIKISDEDLNGVNYDPLKLAEKELESGVLPISVKRPLPQKEEIKLEKIKIQEDKIPSDEVKIKAEQEVEKEIAEGGEIMQLANPEDEQDDGEEISSGGSDEGGEDLD